MDSKKRVLQVLFAGSPDLPEEPAPIVPEIDPEELCLTPGHDLVASEHAEGSGLPSPVDSQEAKALSCFQSNVLTI